MRGTEKMSACEHGKRLAIGAFDAATRSRVASMGRANGVHVTVNADTMGQSVLMAEFSTNCLSSGSAG